MSDKWKHPDWRIRWAQRLRPKWRIADAFNRSPAWCWCDLVDWALWTRKRTAEDASFYRRHGWGRYEAWRDAREHLLARTGVRCQVQSAIQGACYCRKFENGCLASEAASASVEPTS